jgi:hypothetical protein
MAMVQCTERSSDAVYRAAILDGVAIRARREVDNRARGGGGGGGKYMAGDGFGRGQGLIGCTS